MLTLKDLGCDIIQGYYFSRPVPAEEFEKFIIQEGNEKC
jgi:EAL domain-containing protein (putative c-di-GMP-specific phosphodiesterase class I)